MAYRGGQGGGGDSSTGVETVYNGLGALSALTPVYRDGTNTAGVPDIALSNAAGIGGSQKPRKVDGLTAAAITGNGNINIISRGPIDNVDTTAWAEGAEIYLDIVTGQLSDAMPLLPSSQVRVGFVITSAVDGSFLVKIEDLSWVGALQSSNQANERTGFALNQGVPEDLQTVPLQFTTDDAQRKFIITPTVNFAFFSLNNLFIKIFNESFYIYFITCKYSID